MSQIFVLWSSGCTVVKPVPPRLMIEFRSCFNFSSDTILETAPPLADFVVGLLGTRGGVENGRATEKLVVDNDSRVPSSNLSNCSSNLSQSEKVKDHRLLNSNSSQDLLTATNFQSILSQPEKVKDHIFSNSSQNMLIATLPGDNCQLEEDDLCNPNYNYKSDPKPAK